MKKINSKICIGICVIIIIIIGIVIYKSVEKKKTTDYIINDYEKAEKSVEGMRITLVAGCTMKEYGNGKVDYWYITHAHEDHVGR